MAVTRTHVVCSLFAALTLLPACASSPATAGSIAVPAGSKRTLHVRANEPREMRLHLWNRGPGAVTFTPIAPLTLEPGTSPLEPKAGDFRWQIIAATLSIALNGGTEDATIGYELHADGKVTVDVELD